MRATCWLGLAWLLAIQTVGVMGGEPPAGPVHPRLVFTAEQVPGLRAAAQTADGKAMVAALERGLRLEVDGLTVGTLAAGHALQYVLTGDAEHAGRSRAMVERALAGVAYRDSPPLWNARDFKMIFRTRAAVDVALAYDLCFDAWPADFRERVASELAARAREFARGGGGGFNNRPYSNWMVNTKAAGGFLALAVRGDPGAGADLDHVHASARKAFFASVADAYGPGGWCCEGFNYLRYPLTTSGFAYLHALRLSEGRCVVKGTPAEHFARLYVHHLVAPTRPGQRPYVPFFGLNYPQTGASPSGFDQMWERSVWRSADLHLLLDSAPLEHRPAVLWTLREVFGPAGDGTWDLYHPSSVIFALTHLAGYGETAAENPGKRFSRLLADARFGYFVLRNRWQDADDCLLAVHANLLPRRASYSFQDAGSFRLYSHGTRWADQASRADRGWSHEAGISRALENVVQIAGTNGWPGGRILHLDDATDGRLLICMDLSSAYSAGKDLRDARPGKIRATRCVAAEMTGRDGLTCVVVLLDRIAGDGEKVWTLHTGAKAELEKDGFSLRGEGTARARIRFVALDESSLPEFAIDPGKETSALRAKGGPAFLAVITIGEDDRPVAVSLEGSELRIGPGRLQIGRNGLRWGS